MCFNLMLKFVYSQIAQFSSLLLCEIINPSALSEDWVLATEIILLGWQIFSPFFQFLFCWKLGNITKFTEDFYIAYITPLFILPRVHSPQCTKHSPLQKRNSALQNTSNFNFNNLEPGKGKLKLLLNTCHIFLLNKRIRRWKRKQIDCIPKHNPASLFSSYLCNFITHIYDSHAPDNQFYNSFLSFHFDGKNEWKFIV